MKICLLVLVDEFCYDLGFVGFSAILLVGITKSDSKCTVENVIIHYGLT